MKPPASYVVSIVCAPTHIGNNIPEMMAACFPATVSDVASGEYSPQMSTVNWKHHQAVYDVNQVTMVMVYEVSQLSMVIMM